MEKGYYALYLFTLCRFIRFCFHDFVIGKASPALCESKIGLLALWVYFMCISDPFFLDFNKSNLSKIHTHTQKRYFDPSFFLLGGRRRRRRRRITRICNTKTRMNLCKNSRRKPTARFMRQTSHQTCGVFSHDTPQRAWLNVIFLYNNCQVLFNVQRKTIVKLSYNSTSGFFNTPMTKYWII